MAAFDAAGRGSRLGFVLLITALATGCGGDDGERGPAGRDAIIGDRTVAPETLKAQITDVSIESPPVIEFQVTDERGLPVVGINGGVSFTFNKLVPGSGGDTDQWQSYILGDDEGTTNAAATTYGNGTLEDNGNGTYTFTLDQDLEDIDGVSFDSSLTHRVGVELRDVTILGKELNGSSNGVYDFQPSTGDTSGINNRKIATNDTCAGCHGENPVFEFHGGPRNDVEYCVTCHQPDSVDAGTGNTIDFDVMIHKIHIGTQVGNTYCGFGCERFGAPLDDFSDVKHPQDVRNCTTCHNPDNPATPQASNIYDAPNATSCASCHEDPNIGSVAVNVGDVNGETGLTNHPNGAQPNSTCANCHARGSNLSEVDTDKAHEIPEQVAAQRFEYRIEEIPKTAEGDAPVVTFSIVDPTTDDPATQADESTPYDLENDPAFTSSSTSINMDIAWPTTDYTNLASSTAAAGRAPSIPVSINLVSGSGLGTGVTALGGGMYEVDTGAAGVTIPALTPAIGSGAVVIEGHPAGDFDNDGTFDDEVPVTSQVEYFAVNDPADDVTERRVVVEPEKCQTCHRENNGLAFHGNNRTDNVQACVVCHNPNATDVFRRPDDTDNTFDGVSAGATEILDNQGDPVEGLEDQTIDMKYMIHAIHGADMRTTPYVAWGYGVVPHDYRDVLYPKSSADCLACHAEGTYQLPLGEDVLGTTVSAGVTVTATTGPFDFTSGNGATAFDPSDGSETDPTDDHNLSPEAAVCSSCHDSPQAVDHMDGRNANGTTLVGNAFLRDPLQWLVDENRNVTDLVQNMNGNSNYPDEQADINTGLPSGENCAFCHGPGSILSVSAAHGLED